MMKRRFYARNADWQGSMERQIKDSIMRAAEAEGSPDWVAGLEGNIVTNDDEVTIKIKLAPDFPFWRGVYTV